MTRGKVHFHASTTAPVDKFISRSEALAHPYSWCTSVETHAGREYSFPSWRIRGAVELMFL